MFKLRLHRERRRANAGSGELLPTSDRSGGPGSVSELGGRRECASALRYASPYRMLGAMWLTDCMPRASADFETVKWIYLRKTGETAAYQL